MTVIVPESLDFFFVASWLLFYRSGAQPQRSEVGQMRDAADAAVNVQWYAGQLRGWDRGREEAQRRAGRRLQ